MRPTPDDVRDQFDYDPETGELTRKRLRAVNMRPESGSQTNDGYLTVGINGRHELAHRLAWAWVHGAWPPKQIEHVNGDKTDNRIANLRLRNPSAKTPLTMERLRELLDYQPETGKFFWKVTTRGTRAGEEAGCVRPIGYRAISIDYTSYYAHRLAWFYMTGEWPKRQVDHKNGDRDDNRIANLADVSVSQNSHNTVKLGPKNTTGYRGVTRYADKFIAQGMIEGKLEAIAMCDTAEEAAEAYKAWRVERLGALPENNNLNVYHRKSRAKKENLQ